MTLVHCTTAPVFQFLQFLVWLDQPGSKAAKRLGPSLPLMLDDESPIMFTMQLLALQMEQDSHIVLLLTAHADQEPTPEMQHSRWERNAMKALGFSMHLLCSMKSRFEDRYAQLDPQFFTFTKRPDANRAAQLHDAREWFAWSGARPCCCGLFADNIKEVIQTPERLMQDKYRVPLRKFPHQVSCFFFGP